MILKMYTNTAEFRIGVTSEFTLGYKRTSFYSQYVLPLREPIAEKFLKSIKRKSNESS